MQVAHQVLDDLKRIFHHHMVLTDHYVVRPYPGRITLIRPSDAPFAVPTPRDRGWGSWRPTSTSISSPASTTAWSRSRTFRNSPGRSTPACGGSKSRSSLKAKWPSLFRGRGDEKLASQHSRVPPVIVAQSRRRAVFFPPLAKGGLGGVNPA